jgi:hypothetical protein
MINDGCNAIKGMMWFDVDLLITFNVHVLHHVNIGVILQCMQYAER